MASMLDNLRELISPAMLSALSGQTGEPESAVANGLTAAVPAIAAAIANRSDDHSFMKDLAVAATKTSVAADPSSATAAAGSFVSSLFGSGLTGVTGAIARYAGIRDSSAASLIAAAAPLVLGYLGRMMKRDNLTVSDLADRLRDERSPLAAAVPAGFEMPALRTAPFGAARAAWDSAASVAARSGSAPTSSRWAIPLMGLLAALGVAGVIFWNGQKPAQQARVEPDESTPKAVGTSGSFLKPFVRRLPGNVTISFPAGGAEDRLSMYLASAVGGSTTVNCERIAFESGSATLTPESRDQLGNIATILRAYPASKVMVSGHTDNAGNENANVALSKARAEAVASSLRESGVADERIRVEGYGSRRPIADNATAEGRLQNRRVMLDVSVR